MTRVLFPATGFTTDDAAKYYRAVAKYLLPHLRNVPLSFKRYPDTIRGESFWEKDAPSFTPKFVKTIEVPRRDEESIIHYVVANDTRTLTWLAEMGAIELHPFLHRAPKLDIATSVVFDLDPGEGASIVDCCEVAILLREALRAIDFKSFAKVSGSKGLQVYVPLNTNATHSVTEAFARLVAEELARTHPRLVVAKMAKRLRSRKVFIDWSQNADFKTTVSVYSLRTKRERPCVSMPLTWDEVERPKDLDFEPDEAIERLRKMGDLFRPVLTLQQKLNVQWSDRRPRLSSKPLKRVKPALPKPRSQSGRRLFVLPRTWTGDELWLDMLGKFKRWILRPDRERHNALIAVPAGDFAIDESWYRGEVQEKYRKTVTIEDIGAYEVVEGSYQREQFTLWFSGKTLRGAWLLEKIQPGTRHRSWSFRQHS